MNQASLIRKEDIYRETVEKLRSLYQKTMGKNYKRIIKYHILLNICIL